MVGAMEHVAQIDTCDFIAFGGDPWGGVEVSLSASYERALSLLATMSTSLSPFSRASDRWSIPS